MKLPFQSCVYKMNIIIKFYLRMNPGNFEKIFQLIKDDITKENTKTERTDRTRL